MSLGTSIFSTVGRAFGIQSPQLDLQTRINHQRRILMLKEQKRLGRLVMIIFDPAGMHRPVVTDRKLLPAFNALDWQGNPERPGPWLGLSADHQDLLLYGNDGGFLGAVPHPPDVRDATGPVAVDVEQRYRDRTTEKLRNSNFLLIEPVNEIIYKPFGIASWCKIRVLENYHGRHMSFLIDPNTGEGHLVGGRFVIGSVV
jgi:hypothetical protein